MGASSAARKAPRRRRPTGDERPLTMLEQERIHARCAEFWRKRGLPAVTGGAFMPLRRDPRDRAEEGGRA